MASNQPSMVFEALGGKPDDDQLAEAVSAAWDGNKAYFNAAWHGFGGGVWRYEDEQTVKRGIRVMLRLVRDKLPTGISQARVSALVSMLEDELFTPDHTITEAQRMSEMYINLQNGLFNLETFALEPHQRGLMLTNQLEFEYDPAATCPTWERFIKTSMTDELGAVDWSSIYLLQEAIAYSMTARTDLKSSFWLVGKPDSGKSTLISVLRGLMGSLHATIDLNQLAANRFMLANIVGKRVVTFTEADATAFIPDALYKAMVGGTDEIFVDVKNKPGISFVPICKFWWAMNGAPRFNDRSGATLNRLRVILFDRSIPPDQRIVGLSDLLMKERAGIFNWAIVGYRRLMEQGGFTSPLRSEKWREQYALENDTERMYANERLDFGTDASFFCFGRPLYEDYKQWALENGYKPKSNQQVAKDWRRLGLSSAGYQGSTKWFGAKLRPQTPFGI